MTTVHSYVLSPTREGPVRERVWAAEAGTGVLYGHTYVGDHLTTGSFRQTENGEAQFYGDDESVKQSASQTAAELGRLLAGRLATEASGHKGKDTLSFRIDADKGEVVSCRSQEFAWPLGSRNYSSQLFLRDRDNDGTVDWVRGLADDNSFFLEVTRVPSPRVEAVLQALNPLLNSPIQQSRYLVSASTKRSAVFHVQGGERVLEGDPVVSFLNGNQQITLTAATDGVVAGRDNAGALRIDHTR
ncbi:MAG: hypothetical protein HY609_01370 [Deltaproteobacteria bacterium]|nr:hypothetical protein [Deltaproteobacteria bacterium]MBI4223559.1 hypothetical protein [Deltaproteobacteria bacterium]